jgi:putative SOS response-associated peptidase YedK
MPVILGPYSWDIWLDPKVKQTAELAALLLPCPDDWLTAYPVSAFVNNPRNEGPKCVEPITTGAS